MQYETKSKKTEQTTSGTEEPIRDNEIEYSQESSDSKRRDQTTSEQKLTSQINASQDLTLRKKYFATNKSMKTALSGKEPSSSSILSNRIDSPDKDNNEKKENDVSNNDAITGEQIDEEECYSRLSKNVLQELEMIKDYSMPNSSPEINDHEENLSQKDHFNYVSEDELMKNGPFPLPLGNRIFMK